jgi:hypothetical protein
VYALRPACGSKLRPALLSVNPLISLNPGMVSIISLGLTVLALETTVLPNSARRSYFAFSLS